MTLLVSCWFIIESVVTPGGFQKWFYLSFYIHPILLFSCQIFLWLVLLQRVLLVILFFVIEIISFPGLCVFRFLKRFVMYLLMLTRVTNNIEAVEEVESSHAVQNCSPNAIVNSFVSLGKGPILFQVQVHKLQIGICEEGNIDSDEDGDQAVLQREETLEELSLDMDQDISKNECLSDSHESYLPTKNVDISNSSSGSVANGLDMDEHSQSSSSVLEAETDHDRDHDQQEFDPFYVTYEERMKWFDLLSQERRCGISAILSNQPDTPDWFESIDPTDFSVPYFTRGQMARKRLLRSLESDIELVYVAQSCLSWEALHHQYRKVEFLATNTSQDGVFYNNVAGEFQNFQILLERFLEEGRCQGDRVWSYVQGRSSLKSLLHVPQLSGFSEMKNEERRGEATSAKQVLKVIEVCIKAYWEFVKADSNRSWWNFKTSPCVEDPRDLELLADLTKKLKKKEVEVKDLEGKKRNWFKRGLKHVEESQRMEILLAMIDMKLIWRVLHMSMVSSSYLRWCQQKLQHIEIKEGKIFRAWPGPMFPP